MHNLLLCEKHHAEDLRKVEHIFVQTIARYYFDPIIQNYPTHHNTYSTFCHVKEKLEGLASVVDDALAQMESVKEFKEFVAVCFPRSFI